MKNFNFKNYILFFVINCLVSNYLFAQEVQLLSTTPTERWKESKISKEKRFQADEIIFVYPDSSLQQVDGFGGTFNELGWDALQSLDPKQQQEVMESLFGEEGVRFSMARTPIGASDYALGYYSYCDVKEDFPMRDFSISRDRYILIPYIREALKIRPDLKIWASPWTPPAWMKINEHYTLKAGDIAGRTGGNQMEERKNVPGNVTAFNMQASYLQAYALYFSKYVQEYAKEGVTIWAVMPQNEIAWTPNWPCCTWRPEDLAIFIGKYLAPQFREDKLDTEIWCGSVNYPNPDYVRTFLKNSEAASAIKGIGFQWTGEKSIPFISKEYPQYKFMQTENMCGEHENDWTSLEKTWAAVIHYFYNGAASYMYWNMILDETGKSSWGWPQNSMVIIDKNTKEIRYTDEYYLMKHLSKFVQPQSQVLKTSDTSRYLAFQTKEKEFVVIFYNPEEKKNLSFSITDVVFNLQVPAKSVNTIRITL